jgi:hypothetical protein
MINLHQLYNHYLHTDKKHDRVNEKIISYGWTDNGNELTGYYVLTENHRLFYNIDGQFQSMERWPSGLRQQS